MKDVGFVGNRLFECSAPASALTGLVVNEALR